MVVVCWLQDRYPLGLPAQNQPVLLTDLKCQDKHRHHFALCALFDEYSIWITALAGKGNTVTIQALFAMTAPAKDEEGSETKCSGTGMDPALWMTHRWCKRGFFSVAANALRAAVLSCGWLRDFYIYINIYIYIYIQTKGQVCWSSWPTLSATYLYTTHNSIISWPCIPTFLHFFTLKFAFPQLSKNLAPFLSPTRCNLFVNPEDWKLLLVCILWLLPSPLFTFTDLICQGKECSGLWGGRALYYSRGWPSDWDLGARMRSTDYTHES